MIAACLVRRHLLQLLLSPPVAACVAEAPAAPPGVVEVLTTVVGPAPATMAEELPGRVVPWRVAEIRPHVGGIVQRRLFEQGARVRAGQPLFQIIAGPYHADADTARATLAKASATFARARVQADRLKPLVAADAISRQSYDDAVAARDQAAAEVGEARATLRRRQLDVGFSRVASPIAGRLGAANLTEGALLSASDVTPLATVQQIDRVYVDIRQPVEHYAELRASGQAAGPVEIVTASGRVRPVRGRILFSGIAVDPGTGDVLVRVAADNPGELLLRGMIVRARLSQAAAPAALTVPQQAVTRDDQGRAQVSVVGQQDRAHVRPITVGEGVGGRYIVLSGLRRGDRRTEYTDRARRAGQRADDAGPARHRASDGRRLVEDACGLHRRDPECEHRRIVAHAQQGRADRTCSPELAIGRLDLLDAQRTVYDAQHAALTVRHAELTGATALYPALGGAQPMETHQ